MTQKIKLPKILETPKKLLPFILDFNKYRYFLLEGGRGGGKSQTVARFLLYLAGQKNIRICCGREVQNSIDESVYAIIKDLIVQNELTYKIFATRINHGTNGSTIRFRGFREQGSVNIKGLEGIDILWADEAQGITQKTLDIIIPTIRKNNSKLIFTMNRQDDYDPVYNQLKGREDCLHIKINYDENPFCPEVLIKEAQLCKKKNEDIYNHIWGGNPLTEDNRQTIKMVDILENVCNKQLITIEKRFTVADIASMGGDETVIYDMLNTRIEEQEIYTHRDLMDTVGRIVAHQKMNKSTLISVDIIGEGRGVYDRLCEIYRDDDDIIVYGYDGRTKPHDDKTYYNKRAEDWFKAAEKFRERKCDIPNDPVLIQQLSKMPFKYTSNGKLLLEKKEKLATSPDRADAYIMALDAEEHCTPSKKPDKYMRSREENEFDYDFNPATV